MGWAVKDAYGNWLKDDKNNVITYTGNYTLTWAEGYGSQGDPVTGTLTAYWIEEKANPTATPSPTPSASPDPAQTPDPTQTPEPGTDPDPTDPGPSTSPVPSPSTTPAPTATPSPAPKPDPKPVTTPDPKPTAPPASPDPKPTTPPAPQPTVTPEPQPTASPAPKPTPPPVVTVEFKDLDVPLAGPTPLKMRMRKLLRNIRIPGTVEIEDPDIPLANVPQTGDSSRLWALLALVSGAGLALLAAEDHKNRRRAQNL